jgi:ATP-binding cassette subfamily F protein 3
VRLTLAKVLVSEPDLLILDEPTNYLDITSIRWISGFLRSWPREILLVTHDQSFMDSVVTHIAGIHRKVIRKIAGTTDKYYEQILQDEEVYEKTRLNDEKRRREMELFITRFRAKARLAGMVQSRVKTLAKMEKHESLSQMESLAFSFRNLPFAGKQVMQVEAVGFAHDPKVPLIEDFNLTVTPGDRIAIVGKNGKGKTTLLKILARKLAPVSGKVSYNPGIEMGYFEQTNVESLNPTSTVEEEILFSHPDLDRQQARNICGAIMFEGDNALKRISVLSGGEKSRVMLGKLLAKPLNLVLLDEPTNHLDMESCDSLVNALDNFEGAVLLVTHNEMFLHSLANRLIVFKNDAIMVFEGSYQEFLDKEGWDEETVVPRAVAENVDNGPKMSKKEMRKVRSDIISERSRLTGPLKKKVEGLEKEIEEHEEALGRLNVEIQAAVDMNQGGKISEISCAIGEHQTKIDDLFEDLERFSDELDEKMRQFDERLKELES